jgi:hypothetical protein
MARKPKPRAEDEPPFVIGPGVPIDKLKDDPLLLELAMLRVRMKHDADGTGKGMTFGDLLKEASAEADKDYESLASSESFIERLRRNNGQGIPESPENDGKP